MGAAKSVGLITVINIAGALIALGRSVVVVHFFGTGVGIAVYFGVSTLFYVMLGLIQMGQLAEVLLPAYLGHKDVSGSLAAFRAFSVVLNRYLLVLALVIPVLLLVAPLLVKLLLPGFADDSWLLGISIMRWLIPLLGLQVVTALSQMLCHAERMFGWPEGLAVGGQIVSLLTIVALGTQYDVWSLVIALWLGQSFLALGSFWLLSRLGYRHVCRLREEGFDHAAVFRGLGHSLWYVGATQVWRFAFTAGLSHLPESVFAVFKYVETLYSKVNGVLMRPVSVVFYTSFSEAISRGGGELRRLSVTSMGYALMIVSASFVSAVVAGELVLSALWLSTDFDAAHIKIAALLLAVFVGLMMFTACGGLARKVAIASGQIRSQFVGAAVLQLLSAGLAYTTIQPFGLGAAMACVTFNVLALAALSVGLVWKKQGWLFFYSVRRLGVWFLAIILGTGLGSIVAGMDIIHQYFGPSRMAMLVHGLLASLVGVVTLLITAGALGAGEVREPIRVIRKRLI